MSFHLQVGYLHLYLFVMLVHDAIERVRKYYVFVVSEGNKQEVVNVIILS